MDDDVCGCQQRCRPRSHPWHCSFVSWTNTVSRVDRYVVLRRCSIHDLGQVRVRPSSIAYHLHSVRSAVVRYVDKTSLQRASQSLISWSRDEVRKTMTPLNVSGSVPLSTVQLRSMRHRVLLTDGGATHCHW
jgi:hypothetical protein